MVVIQETRKKIDTSVFSQKPYLRTKYIASKIKEHVDLKNQFRIRKLPKPISIREAASKSYVVKKFKNLSRIKNIAHVNFIDKNLANFRFV